MPYLRNVVHVPAPLAAALRCAAEGAGISLQQLLHRAITSFAARGPAQRDDYARQILYGNATADKWERLPVAAGTLQLARCLDIAFCSPVQTCRVAWEWFVQNRV